ncbi:MAG: NADH-quinone oxidoreductase subunit J [Ignavibacteria bacterium]|nr:NADH-quinone oxidoreductase subunit J [Ignavibacteria bacterium]
MEKYIFYILSLLAIVSAILMITRKNPIVSALWLIFNFFTISGIYLLLKAQFIAIIQVLVYAGAIMVLFLFVIMLLNLDKVEEFNFPEPEKTKRDYKKLTAILLSILLMFLLGYSVYLGFAGKFEEENPEALNIGKAEFLGKKLFLEYSYQVEVIGLLLLAAVIGAVILAKKKL